jgi:hypothetical protein
MPRVLLAIDRTLPAERFQDCRELAKSFANFLGEPVELAFARPDLVLAARIGVDPDPGDDPVEIVMPQLPQPATMSSAEFVYRADGRPDWQSMWQSFCDLALYGGPPHRGVESRLVATPAAEAAETPSEGGAVEEMRRGIWETTQLYSEVTEPGWLAVTCRSRAMAVWMAASIILENVEARFDGDRLLVPASETFALADQVKSVITVVAKTHHYWIEHVLTQELMARARSGNGASEA